MRFTTAAFTLGAFASSALAHMEMSQPPPFRSSFNKAIKEDTVDFDNNAPLKPDGSDFPCKGYATDFGQSPAGDPTATWPAGSTQQVVLADSGDPEDHHDGGSCQLSLSFDGGKSFKVIKSYIGNCVRVTSSGVDPNQTYEYTVPSDAKSGDAMLTWSWFNRVGNREMYMNCATITINGGGQSTLDSYPDIFKCHIGNGCTIPEGTDVVFQNPGNDVTYDQGNLGNATLGDPENGMGTPLPMPYGSGVAVGVFLGLGAGVIIGLVGYYAWTWYKLRSAAVDKPTKA